VTEDTAVEEREEQLKSMVERKEIGWEK